jgi:hypothetical protein
MQEGSKKILTLDTIKKNYTKRVTKGRKINFFGSHHLRTTKKNT